MAACERGGLAGGAVLMAVVCMCAALWAAPHLPTGGWLCYLLSLGWSVIGCTCYSLTKN
ncbi:MAG: hypothetical protein SFU85_12915 [Candidatus Methylacidiphilales bacterium]|nr:hypothetical protein [Candidatus Methylacidiphilales bacterium]